MDHDPRAAFLEAASVPLDASHASGTLARAGEILAAHPEVATADIHTAATLGDDEAVRRFLAADPESARAKGGTRGWDALTWLCFSRYLRLDPARSDGFVRAAEALLDAGADPNTGFFSEEHQPNPTLESAIYGAAGVAHHPGVTRVLLEHGADPNDDETPYHAPEGFDDGALRVLVESGRLTTDSLTTMLHRKLDWHHYEGARWLLEHGADPNHVSHWGNRALHHALGRDNALAFFELLMDHGADPTLPPREGRSAFARAARVGRADVLELFARRGFRMEMERDDAFAAACALADEARVREMMEEDPTLVPRLRGDDPALLPRFAGAGNTAGVRLLLDLGWDVAAVTDGPRWVAGDTALHLAVWRDRGETVELLLARGAPLEATTRNGETPLSLAVRAMTEPSEWTPHESPALVARLLAAGARPESVKRFPTGSPEADALLRQYGRK
ncbi:MAG TPA: ankyrin repeat domain-containing protein [Longimicrobiaceae bacterium]